MNFRNALDERLRKVDRFSGVKCGAELSRDLAADGRIGYVLNGMCCQGGGTVEAGIIVNDGMMIGVFYSVQGKVYKVGFTEGKFLCDIDFVLDRLAECLGDDRDVGNSFWVVRRFEDAQEPLLASTGNLVNEKTGGKLFSIGPVLVDFGFTATFANVVLGWNDGKYVMAVAEGQGSMVRPCYEQVFNSADAGNKAFVTLKRSAFKSKKGNTVYKMNSHQFAKYHKVDGQWIMAR